MGYSKHDRRIQEKKTESEIDSRRAGPEVRGSSGKLD
jgi:hypothetical protein